MCGLSAPGIAVGNVAPADATDHLTIAISGHITAKCDVQILGQSQASFGEIMDGNTGRAAPATLDLPFSLECNAPYTATLYSKHGGLAFDGNPASGFSTLIDYSAAIGLSASAGGLSLTCNSSEMRGGKTDDTEHGSSHCNGHSNGHGYSKGNGRVHLTLRGDGRPLLKGTYSDELIMRVSPHV